MRKIRITSEAGIVNRTKIYDVETGCKIPMVQAVSFGISVDSPGFEGIMVCGEVSGKCVSEKIQVVEMHLA
jgi:hypothetical protein